MVQEFQVLKCYSCSTYQVHMVKKAKKWECKLCHEKQSTKEIFGKGSGKDCRIHVQKLNALKATREGNNWTDDQFSEFLKAASTSCVPNSGSNSVSTQPTTTPSNVGNKWDKYLDNNEGEQSPEEDNRDLLEGSRNQQRKRRKVSNNDLDFAGKAKRSCVKTNAWSVPTQKDTGSVNAWSAPTQKDTGSINTWSVPTQKDTGSVYNKQLHASFSKNNTHSNQYNMNNHDNSHIKPINQSQVTTHVKLPQHGSSKVHQHDFPSPTTAHLQNDLKQSISAVSSKWSKYLINEDDDDELSEIEDNNEEYTREIDGNFEDIDENNIYNRSPSERTTQLSNTHSTFNTKSPSETNMSTTQLSNTHSTFNTKSPSETNMSTTQLSNTHSTFNNRKSDETLEFNNTNRKSNEKLEYLQDILNIKHHHSSTNKIENSGLEDKSCMVNQHSKEKNINFQLSLFEETDDTLLDELVGDF